MRFTLNPNPGLGDEDDTLAPPPKLTDYQVQLAWDLLGAIVPDVKRLRRRLGRPDFADYIIAHVILIPAESVKDFTLKANRTRAASRPRRKSVSSESVGGFMTLLRSHGGSDPRCPFLFPQVNGGRSIKEITVLFRIGNHWYGSKDVRMPSTRDGVIAGLKRNMRFQSNALKAIWIQWKSAVDAVTRAAKAQEYRLGQAALEGMRGHLLYLMSGMPAAASSAAQPQSRTQPRSRSRPGSGPRVAIELDDEPPSNGSVIH